MKIPYNDLIKVLIHNAFENEFSPEEFQKGEINTDIEQKIYENYFNIAELVSAYLQFSLNLICRLWDENCEKNKLLYLKFHSLQDE